MSQIRIPATSSRRIGRKPRWLARDGRRDPARPQPMRAHRARHGGGLRQRPHRRVPLLLPRPGPITSTGHQGGAAACAAIRLISTPKGPAGMKRVPQVASYRGCVRQPRGGRPEPGGLSRPSHVVRRHGRSRAGRRARGHRRDVQARVQGQLEALPGNLCDAAHRCSPTSPRSSRRSEARIPTARVRSRSARCAKRRAVLVLGGQCRHLDLSNGHSFLGDYHDDAKLVAGMSFGVSRYVAAMEARKGKEAHQADPLEVRRWNGASAEHSFMSQFRQLRGAQSRSVRPWCTPTAPAARRARSVCSRT